MSAIEKIDRARLPKHVAIIMDGNGRWAKQRGLLRSIGHENGVTTVRQITEMASELGIGFLTLYTFSTENWNRPQDEVDALMNLIVVSKVSTKEFCNQFPVNRRIEAGKMQEFCFFTYLSKVARNHLDLSGFACTVKSFQYD